MTPADIIKDTLRQRRGKAGNLLCSPNSGNLEMCQIGSSSGDKFNLFRRESFP